MNDDQSVEGSPNSYLEPDYQSIKGSNLSDKATAKKDQKGGLERFRKSSSNFSSLNPSLGHDSDHQGAVFDRKVAGFVKRMPKSNYSIFTQSGHHEISFAPDSPSKVPRIRPPVFKGLAESKMHKSSSPFKSSPESTFLKIPKLKLHALAKESPDKSSRNRQGSQDHQKSPENNYNYKSQNKVKKVQKKKTGVPKCADPSAMTALHLRRVEENKRLLKKIKSKSKLAERDRAKGWNTNTRVDHQEDEYHHEEAWDEEDQATLEIKYETPMRKVKKKKKKRSTKKNSKKKIRLTDDGEATQMKGDGLKSPEKAKIEVDRPKRRIKGYHTPTTFKVSSPIKNRTPQPQRVVKAPKRRVLPFQGKPARSNKERPQENQEKQKKWKKATKDSPANPEPLIENAGVVRDSTTSKAANQGLQGHENPQKSSSRHLSSEIGEPGLSPKFMNRRQDNQSSSSHPKQPHANQHLQYYQKLKNNERREFRKKGRLQNDGVMIKYINNSQEGDSLSTHKKMIISDLGEQIISKNDSMTMGGPQDANQANYQSYQSGQKPRTHKSVKMGLVAPSSQKRRLGKHKSRENLFTSNNKVAGKGRRDRKASNSRKRKKSCGRSGSTKKAQKPKKMGTSQKMRVPTGTNKPAKHTSRTPGSKKSQKQLNHKNRRKNAESRKKVNLFSKPSKKGTRNHEAVPLIASDLDYSADESQTSTLKKSQLRRKKIKEMMATETEKRKKETYELSLISSTTSKDYFEGKKSTQLDQIGGFQERKPQINLSFDLEPISSRRTGRSQSEAVEPGSDDLGGLEEGPDLGGSGVVERVQERVLIGGNAPLESRFSNKMVFESVDQVDFRQESLGIVMNMDDLEGREESSEGNNVGKRDRIGPAKLEDFVAMLESLGYEILEEEIEISDDLEDEAPEPRHEPINLPEPTNKPIIAENNPSPVQPSKTISSQSATSKPTPEATYARNSTLKDQSGLNITQELMEMGYEAEGDMDEEFDPNSLSSEELHENSIEEAQADVLDKKESPKVDTFQLEERELNLPSFYYASDIECTFDPNDSDVDVLEKRSFKMTDSKSGRTPPKSKLEDSMYRREKSVILGNLTNDAIEECGIKSEGNVDSDEGKS